jgi:transcriptional regulator with XRE-family HTH domain
LSNLVKRFFENSQTFLFFFRKSVDFSKPIWYNIEKGGEWKMYKPRVESCGQRISEALKYRNMKQADLCKLAKVPKSSLSLYLSGAYEPKQDRIYDMARVLNVSEAWLMGYDVPMERQDPKKKQSPEEIELNEGEKMLLELFRKIPEDQQGLVLNLIRAALGNPEQ